MSAPEVKRYTAQGLRATIVALLADEQRGFSYEHLDKVLECLAQGYTDYSRMAAELAAAKSVIIEAEMAIDGFLPVRDCYMIADLRALESARDNLRRIAEARSATSQEDGK